MSYSSAVIADLIRNSANNWMRKRPDTTASVNPLDCGSEPAMTGKGRI